MTSPALAAVVYLQQHSARSGDIYEIERHDRALDEIIANLDRTDPAPFQSRSALANAAKLIQHRRTIRMFGSLDKPRPDGSQPDVGQVDWSYAVVELYQWIDTSPSLSSSERQLLHDLASGEDAESLAARDGVPVARMRERISRARAAGRLAYRREVA